MSWISLNKKCYIYHIIVAIIFSINVIHKLLFLSFIITIKLWLVILSQFL